MHLFLVCAKLYKSELMQAQVEADVNDMILSTKFDKIHDICMLNKCGSEGVMQVGECKIMLTKMEFKGKCYTCEKYGHKQNKCA